MEKLNHNLNHDEPFDPELEAMLDEALSPQSLPGGVPADLVDRIMVRTTPMLGRRHTVLAVLGPQIRVLAFAACVMVAIGAGLWLYFSGVTAPTVTTLPTRNSSVAEIVPDSEIDTQIAVLAVRVDQASRRADQNVVSDNEDRTARDLNQLTEGDENPVF